MKYRPITWLCMGLALCMAQASAAPALHAQHPDITLEGAKRLLDATMDGPGIDESCALTAIARIFPPSTTNKE